MNHQILPSETSLQLSVVALVQLAHLVGVSLVLSNRCSSRKKKKNNGHQQKTHKFSAIVAFQTIFFGVHVSFPRCKPCWWLNYPFETKKHQHWTIFPSMRGKKSNMFEVLPPFFQSLCIHSCQYFAIKYRQNLGVTCSATVCGYMP